MRPRCRLIMSCAALGFSNIFGQTVVPAPTLSATNAAAAAAAAALMNGASGSTAVTTVPIGPATPRLPVTLPVTVVPPRVLPTTPSDARITNLSTRARVAGDSPLITGFAISGSTPLTVLVRAIGPTLGVFGLTGTLAAPHLKLHDANGAVLMENAGWGGAPALVTATAVAGAFPLPAGSADAVAVATLAPGNYSVEVGDDAGLGGVVLVEIYAVDGPAAGSHLANVSTRNTVAANGGEFISGFTVSGTMPAQFLLRGVGPGLTQFGVTGVLNDPVLAIFNSAGTKIATNDDWNGGTKPAAGAVVAVANASQGAASQGTASQVAVSVATATAAAVPDPVSVASQSVGAFALAPNSFDAALVMTLAPGAYTVQVTGGSTVVLTPTPSPSTTTGNTGAAQQATTGATFTVSLIPPTPGVALLEIYQLP